MTELNNPQDSRAHSRPNTTPRFARLQSCRIPYAADPRANRAIATAISRQRIDPPVASRREEGRRRNRRELRQRASIADAIYARKPVGCASPSKTFKHVSRQTNIFLRLENRHFEQYAAFYASSRIASQSLPNAFYTIFPKTHCIERTSTHSFFARYTPFDTKAHCRQPATFRASHDKRHAMDCSAIHAFDCACRTSRSKQTPHRSHKPNKSAPSATFDNERRKQESASRKPNAAQSTSSRRLLVLRPKTSINIDFLPMFHVKRRRIFALWRPLCPSALPLQPLFDLLIGAVQALFIADLFFALAIQSPSATNRQKCRRMRLSYARRNKLARPTSFLHTGTTFSRASTLF